MIAFTVQEATESLGRSCRVRERAGANGKYVRHLAITLAAPQRALEINHRVLFMHCESKPILITQHA